METNLTTAICAGVVNAVGLWCLILVHQVWIERRWRINLLVMCIQCTCIGLGLLALNNWSCVPWLVGAFFWLWRYWRTRPPRKRRKLKEIAKAKFRKMTVRIPRPPAPTPVGT